MLNGKAAADPRHEYCGPPGGRGPQVRNRGWSIPHFHIIWFQTFYPINRLIITKIIVTGDILRQNNNIRPRETVLY